MNPNAVPLPTLPEPDESLVGQDQIEIERVDDTPEPDRRAEAPGPDTYQAVDDEAQDQAYGQKVQGRIKQLRHVYHEERRQKEAAQRERDSLVQYAQNLQSEVVRYRNLVSSGERVLLDQVQGRAEAEIAQAREQLLHAHGAGDAEEIVKAQEKLSRAIASHQHYSSLRPSSPAPDQPGQPGQPGQAPQGQPGQLPGWPYPPQPQLPQMQQQPGPPPPPDERTAAWFARNTWWAKPGNDNAKRYMLVVDAELKQNGILPSGATADAYWATVDQQLTDMFPQLTGSVPGNTPNANGQAHTNGREPQTRSRPVTATSGNRPASGPVKVRLKDSELRIAKRLGVTPEQYAREVLRMQRPG